MDEYPFTDRRNVLKTLVAGSAVALAGCGGSDSGGDDSAGEATMDDDGMDDGETDTGGDQPPGGDVMGGPDDLQSEATVEALALDADQGAGQNVFSPAVVWLEEGATVTWENVSGNHSVTAYHPNNDKPNRIPTGAASFNSGVMSEGDTFEHTFDEPGVYNYYCTPHEGLGMVGLVIVSEAAAGPGTEPPAEVESSAAADGLSQLLDLAGIETEATARSYDWTEATWDSYWYSLYNMSTNIAMAGNGVPFPIPGNDAMANLRDQRLPAMLENSDAERPPVTNPNLTFAPFTEGDPSFTQQPVLENDTGRPDASTLAWDPEQSSGVVSPSSLAWSHLKGVTWAKNFQAHFDVLPTAMAPKFRAQLLTTLAQVGINAALLVGGSRENGALTDGDSWELLSQYRPAEGVIEDDTRRPHHHSAMLWFLSDITSLAQNGWFGYVNPRPLIPKDADSNGVFDPPKGGIQEITDGVAQTTMELFAPENVANQESTRSVGEMLAAVGYYGPQAGSEERRSAAADYVNGLTEVIEVNLTDSGRVENGADNQAATQGIVGQGLVWASQLDGVDHTDMAEDVLGYLLDELWDAEAGTFASSADATTYTISARDAGDITGGLNAADAVLDMDIKEIYAEYFDQTINRGRLQRAERPPSRDENAENTLPLPPAAGGENGQAAVYNAEIEYDPDADEWTVTDDRFDTEQSLYLANQEIWISQWGGDFYQGRGVPGESDEPPQ
jgi:plastocyanin